MDRYLARNISKFNAFNNFKLKFSLLSAEHLQLPFQLPL